MPLGSAEQVFSAADALTLLLTVESLLFAALSLGVVLGAPVQGARNISTTAAYRLAMFAVGALTVVAVGALAAWWQVFVDHWPDSTLRAFQALAVVAGIGVQPIISFIVARSIVH